MFFIAGFLVFHRPVPWNFTDSVYERIVMFCLELVMRFTYIYPPLLLYDDPFEQLNYTRAAGGFLLSFITPDSLLDDELYIDDVFFGSVSVRVYRPRDNRTNRAAIVFFHGGAFVVGNVQMFESVTRQLAKDTQMVVVSVDYRLAPEHVFPVGLDDCQEALIHMMRYGWKEYNVDPLRIAIMGDSAGGGLVAAVAQRLRHRHDIPPLKAQIMVYPLVQFHNLKTSSYDYYYREMDGTAFLDPRGLVQYYLMYAGIDIKSHSRIVDIILNNEHVSTLNRQILDEYIDFNILPQKYRMRKDLSFAKYDTETAELVAPFLMNPDFAPMVQANLSGLPTSLVVTCEHDILRDEGILYAHRLMKAGVQTTWKHLPTSFHGLLNFHTTLGTAGNAFRYISDWILSNV
uniref:Abhydrolase_3 domain-containing protein n=1 Tax=Syphacia muris TaxID=451379 RepID=A0A0N5AK75_9BILA